MEPFLIAVIMWWHVPGQPDTGLYKALKVYHAQSAKSAELACTEEHKKLGLSFKKLLPVEVSNNTRVILGCRQVRNNV